MIGVGLDLLLPLLIGIPGAAMLGAIVWIQLKRGNLQELRDSLDTARNELQIQMARGDRLEGELRLLEDRMKSVEADNRVLRYTLTSGVQLAPEFSDQIAQALALHEAKSQAQFAEMIGAFERRVLSAHRQFVDLLPKQVGEPLQKAMGNEA